MTPELRVLRALDDLRDAMGAMLAERAPDRPADGLLTMTEAARRLDISRATVIRWADSGHIATVGPRNARRVAVAEIERLTGRDIDGAA